MFSLSSIYDNNHKYYTIIKHIYENKHSIVNIQTLQSPLHKHCRPSIIRFIYKTPPFRIFHCIPYSRKHFELRRIYTVFKIISSNKIKFPILIGFLRIFPLYHRFAIWNKAGNHNIVQTRKHCSVWIPQFIEIRRIALNDRCVRNRKDEIDKACAMRRNHNIRFIKELQLILER